MAKSELGTKRVDPETGKKFYDLGRDPIISPYTGKAYPLSYFESVSESQIMEKEVDSEDDIDVVLGDNEFISIDKNVRRRPGVSNDSSFPIYLII